MDAGPFGIVHLKMISDTIMFPSIIAHSLEIIRQTNQYTFFKALGNRIIYVCTYHASENLKHTFPTIHNSIKRFKDFFCGLAVLYF